MSAWCIPGECSSTPERNSSAKRASYVHCQSKHTAAFTYPGKQQKHSQVLQNRPLGTVDGASTVKYYLSLCLV